MACCLEEEKAKSRKKRGTGSKGIAEEGCDEEHVSRSWPQNIPHQEQLDCRLVSGGLGKSSFLSLSIEWFTVMCFFLFWILRFLNRMESIWEKSGDIYRAWMMLMETSRHTHVRQIPDSLLFPRGSATEILWDVDENLLPWRNVKIKKNKNCIKTLFIEVSFTF